ncbi:hypothetical protein ACFQJ5_16655 [Halomicroarcula sp. GCM10025324]|uniref:hypothetical protein n=1 Tax=Haloarcula TaxID=2237 RepID=UPI0023E88F10|nr:hypothetical protein [Halomicroarcula sp. ZS-22-S1]
MSSDSGRIAQLFDGSTGDTTPLKSDSGTSVDWKSLVMATLGLFTTIIASNVAHLIDMVMSLFAIQPLQKYAEFLETIVSGLVTSPGNATDAAFAQTAAFVADKGLFAFPIALGIVVVMAYIVAEVRKRL